MNNMNKRNHSVAIVPLWLVRTLQENNASFDKAVDFAELASITSVTDVCFYYHYLCQLDTYTDKAFGDMENIIYSPQNAKWVLENQELIAKNLKSFTISFDKCRKDLADRKAPLLVRKTPFRPLASGASTLLLLATDGEMSYDRVQFYSDCMGELNKQMSPNSSSKFDAFKLYCLS